MIKTLKNPCSTYTILWILYYLQGSLFASVPGAGMLVMIIFLVLSLYYWIKVVREDNNLPILLRGFNVMLFLFTAYGVFRIIDPTVIQRTGGVIQNPTIFLKCSYISLLPIFTFYHFCKRGYLTEEWIRKFTLVFFGFAILQYFNYESNALASYQDLDYEVELVTNNTGYLFISLLCLIPFFYNKQYYKYILLICIIVFVISAAKRGAIICLIVGIYVLLRNEFKNTTLRNKSLTFILGGLCVFGAYRYITYMMDTNLAYAARFMFDESNTSGRNSIYDFFINVLKNEDNIIRLIFGYGADGTIALSGNFAHNDWLEIAINHGVVGLICYIYYYIAYIKSLKKLRADIFSHISFVIIFTCCILKSFFSMSIMDYQIFESAVLAFCLVHTGKSANGII